jgi:hypothetical protein
VVRDEILHGETTGGVKGLHQVGPTAAGAAERSPMWLLMIVFLNIVPGLEKITVLNTFGTSEKCQSERKRIGFEMAAAYPYERDFVIACQLNPKHSSIRAAEGSKGESASSKRNMRTYLRAPS